MPTKRTLARQLADARAQIRSLADDREQAQEDADTGTSNTKRLCQQIDALREENAQLRTRLEQSHPMAPAPARWQRERSRLRRDLALSERARARLDALVLQLGHTNDALSREAYDRTQEATR